MPLSARSQIAATFLLVLGLAYIWVSAPPFFVNLIFAILCVMWSAWILRSIFQGSDELKAASLRYALAAASGVGVPLSLALVMLMTAAPGIQQTIANMAAASPLPPSAAGFGLGVTFTLVVMCTVVVIANSVWWASKR